MAKYAKFFSVGGGAGTNNLQLPVGTVLDATLRQVQDGTGTGSPLYLSTGSVRIGTTAASAMYWDNTNNRLGVGVTSSTDLTAQLSVGNTDFVVGANLGYSTYYGSSVNGSFQIIPSGNNTQLFIRPSGASGSFNSAYWSRIQNASYTTEIAMGEYHSYLSLGKTSVPQMASLFNNGNFVVGSTSDLSARVGIKGSGSTSATTSLLVQNSGGTNLLQMRDDGQLFIGTTASGLGKILVPHDSVYGDRAFLSIQGGTDLLSTRSNALLLINGGSFWAPDLNLTAVNQGLRGNTANQTSNSSVVLSGAVNSYNGTSQNDACDLVYIQNRGTTLQAAGSINWIKMDGNVYEAGGGGNKWCTGIYYNPSFTGGTLLANSHYCYHATSGQMMVNTTSPNASAQLQVDSTTRGFLPPRMTTAQKLAITSPAEGLAIYDTDLKRPCFYNGTAWTTL